MRFSKALVALLTPTASILLAVACADTESNVAPPGEDGGSNLPPGPDTGAPKDDGGRDVKPDAPVRTCSDDGFCHTVLPDNQTLQAVWADGTGTAWAGTKFGTILRFDGTEWKIVTSGLGEINAIWGASPTEIWLAGAKGLHRGTGATSAEITFKRVALESNADVHIKSVWGAAANDVWAVGARTDGANPAGRVYHFAGTITDGAPVWTVDPLSATPGILSYDRVWGSAATGVWIGQSVAFDEWGSIEQSILRRPAGGTKFEKVVLPGVPDENYPDAPIGLFLGATLETDTSVWIAARTLYFGRGYFHGVSADNGLTFTWTVSGFWNDEKLEFNVLAGSPNGVWAAGNYGRLATWDGKKFVQASTEVKPFPLIAPFFDAWTAPSGELWVVGKEIALHRAKK